MAKIGIVTFSNTVDNYGQVLQYLAQQEYLEKRGHKVYLIRVGSSKSIAGRSKAFIKKILIKAKVLKAPKPYKLEPTYQKWKDCTDKYEMLYPRRFEEFRVKYFNLYETTYKKLQCKVFDVYSVGSDQIWASVSPYTFLAFANDKCKKIAIAPSLGKTCYNADEIAEIGNYIKDFSFITVREQSGVDVCHQAGYNAAIKILDPTFLITSDLYDKYSDVNVNKHQKPYIFLYLLGGDIDLPISEIYDFAAKYNLSIKYVASQGREDGYEKVWATIPEWLDLMHNASYVITNSFHGMALSIIYRKQFMTIPIVGEMKGMNERIENLANEFSLQKRIYTKSLDQLKEKIDYNLVNKIIANNKVVLDALMINNNL